jgi:hypothetical protein
MPAGCWRWEDFALANGGSQATDQARRFKPVHEVVDRRVEVWNPVVLFVGEYPIGEAML